MLLWLDQSQRPHDTGQRITPRANDTITRVETWLDANSDTEDDDEEGPNELIVVDRQDIAVSDCGTGNCCPVERGHVLRKVRRIVKVVGTDPVGIVPQVEGWCEMPHAASQVKDHDEGGEGLDDILDLNGNIRIL